MPRVVRAGTFVYFCTNKMSSLDAARVLAVIVFQALWQYVDALRGQGKDGQRLLTQKLKSISARWPIHNVICRQKRDYFLHAHGPAALFARPTTNIYAMAGKAYEHPESKKYVGEVVNRVKRKHIEGVKRRADLNIALLKRFNTQFKKV